MTFLNPAILIGLAAAALPLIIHLFNIRKVKNIEFSTLMFLEEIQKNKIRRIKIKQWLLLLIRTLLIIFIVLPFARPTLEEISLGNNSSTKATIAVILDNSFSMQLKKEKGTAFNQNRSSAKKLINSFQDEDNISLLSLSDGLIVKSGTKKELLKAIDNINISGKSFEADKLFGQTKLIFDESKNLINEIYLFSDFQENYFNKKINSSLNRNVRMFFVKSDFENFDNLSVTDLKLQSKILVKNKNINFEAEIYNSSDSDLKGKVASLFINGERKSQKSFDVKADKKIKINFETVLDKSGLIECVVVLEDDVIPEDNKRYLSFVIPDKLNVLMLSDINKDNLFLKLVLQNNVSLFDINLVEKKSSELNSVNLSDFDLLILIGNREIEKSDEIRKYVEEGKTLLYFPSSKPVKENIDRFLSQFSSSRCVDIKEVKSVNERFEKIDFDHPLFSDLFSNDFNKFTSPEVLKYIKLSSDPSVKKIISFIDDSVTFFEKEIGKGKLLYFTISPELSYSNFPVKGIFAPVIIKTVIYGGVKINSENVITINDKILIRKSRIINNLVKVETPDLREEFLNIQPGFSKRFVEYNKMKNFGTYKFYSDSKLINYFSVNFDSSESELNYLAESEVFEKMKTINPNGFNKVLKLDENISDSVNNLRYGTELWQYFLMLALFTAFLEMYISRGVAKSKSVK